MARYPTWSLRLMTPQRWLQLPVRALTRFTYGCILVHYLARLSRSKSCWLMQALQEIVSSIRNARAEYGVELGRKIPAQIIIADEELSAALQAEMPVLCSLGKLDETQVYLSSLSFSSSSTSSSGFPCCTMMAL